MPPADGAAARARSVLARIPRRPGWRQGGRMSWFRKLLPPKIKREAAQQKKAVPGGPVEQVPLVRGGALLHRPREQPSRLPEVRLPQSAVGTPAPGPLPRSRGPRGARLRGRARWIRSSSRTAASTASASTEAEKETGETDALVVMQGAVKNVPLVAAAFEFGFLGGSMGSVVGERFVRAVQPCCDECARLSSCFTATGGARMQEGLLSLMQMAKTTAALHQLTAARQPFISILTDPTMGGVSASFAFIGDVVIAEPGALIGFAGPRVIEQTVRETLPEGFQRSEFLLEKGAIDMIVDRRQLRDKVARLDHAAQARSRARGLSRRSLDDWLDLHLRAASRDASRSGLDRVHEVWKRMSRHPGDGRRPNATSSPSAAPTARAPPARSSSASCSNRATASACYTSPHLLRYNERVRVRGDDCADERLMRRLRARSRRRAARRRSPISSSARWRHSWCSPRSASTCAILEVGLGGRLDAVNIIDADCADRGERGPRPPGVPRQRPRIDRLREGGHLPRGAAGDLRRHATRRRALVAHAQSIGADAAGARAGLSLRAAASANGISSGAHGAKRALPMPALARALAAQERVRGARGPRRAAARAPGLPRRGEARPGHGAPPGPPAGAARAARDRARRRPQPARRALARRRAGRHGLLRAHPRGLRRSWPTRTSAGVIDALAGRDRRVVRGCAPRASGRQRAARSGARAAGAARRARAASPP